MRLAPLAIEGAFEIASEPKRDERGFFARTLDLDALRGLGLCDRFVQESLSHNARRGTLRGLHFQAAPAEETKIVTCVAGRIFDVVLDLRSGSATYGRWESRELAEGASLYVPPGCAHGFQTLEAGTSVLYRITPSYVAELARGVHALDPQLAIPWPVADALLSPRDRSLPHLRELSR